jgi:hypothetical protein
MLLLLTDVPVPSKSVLIHTDAARSSAMHSTQLGGLEPVLLLLFSDLLSSDLFLDLRVWELSRLTKLVLLQNMS